MNVILDIDETFVQFVGRDDWLSLDASERTKYEISSPDIETNPTRGGTFILRPHFVEFFTYLKDNTATVNLWTWSDAEYADGVKKMIEGKVPGAKISNVWVDEDVNASIAKYTDKEKGLRGHNKDLNYIWYDKKKFQPCNTILIDDLKENTDNKSNRQNSINLKAFNVLGEKLDTSTKTKTRIRSGHYTDLSKDDTLLKVIELLKKAKSRTDVDYNDCELPFPFDKVQTVGGRRKKTRRSKLRRSKRFQSTRRR